MTIPTVHAIRKLCRAFGPASRVEVGIRCDTEDSRQWGDDDELDDVLPLADILRQWRKVAPDAGIVLDLYVYLDSPLETELVHNLTLLCVANAWIVTA